MLKLIEVSQEFSNKNNIDLHYAGLPYSRYIIAESVKSELVIFLIISILITSIILFIFLDLLIQFLFQY